MRDWAHSPPALEADIQARHPDRFSPATLRSLAQNINATFTHKGHFSGRGRKVRHSAQPTPASVAYALLVSHAAGARGPELLRTLKQALPKGPVRPR